MLSTRDYFERLKTKLDEWNSELEVIEQRARVEGGDAAAQIEHHKMELQDMFLELQQRIDELRQGLQDSVPSVSSSMDAAWARLSKDLEDMSDHLYPGN
ncbi:MAG: hypothetical protein P1U64_00685 [Alcanivoracaceae bacterium]|jgi:predicted nuclease with TOPRIM domain|nr:hypothetical protein [Alcanivoracaceae bacterium]